MRTFTRLRPKVLFFALLTLVFLVGNIQSGVAQKPGGVVPASYESGSFFNQKLGTALRFNYHTRGYGTQEDVFSLGAMKILSLDEESTVFLDGQGTLSEGFGGGFNLGIGYRQMTMTSSPVMSIDPQRILGLGFWTDGQSTSSDNFFTQLGFNLESLGDSFDMRLNGHFPLQRNKSSDAVLTGTGTPFFVGNNLFSATEEFSVDTAHSVIDGEFAKRINDLEAWAFVGGYQLGGGGVDTTGYRLGVRGYAVPDLALSLQVTDDDLYATNVMFGVTWFIGRTNKCNGPCGTLVDRFREPVLRNDFIATTSRRASRASGDAEIDSDTGVAENFFFVDSNAAAGGNGTVENPFRTLTEAEAAHGADDTIIGLSGSTFTDTLALKDNVDFFGMGDDITHSAEFQSGSVTLPGTSSGNAPVINLAAGATGITTADNNRVNNFTINNGQTAVSAVGSNAPQLGNLDINNTTGDAVVLRDVTGTAVVENTVVISGAQGRAVLIDGGSSSFGVAATVNNSAGLSVQVANRTGGTITYSGTVNDSGQGMLINDNSGGSLLFTNALTLNTGVFEGISLADNAGSSISFSDLDITTTSGTGFLANGGGNLSVTSAVGTNTIQTDTGIGLSLVDMTIDAGNVLFDEINIANGSASGINLQDLDGAGGVTVNGGTLRTAGTAIDVNNAPNAAFSDVTVNNDDTAGAGIIVQNNGTGTRGFTDVVVRTRDQVAVNVNNNSDGTTTFANLTADSTAGGSRAVDVQNNTGGNVNLNTATITSTTGDGVFVDNNSSTVTVSMNDLDIDTTAGTGLSIRGDGTITTGGTSTIDSTSGVGIDVEDARNVTVVGVTVNAAGANAVNVSHSDALASRVALNNLTVASAGARGVNVSANGTGEFDLTMIATTIGGVGTEGIALDTGASAGRVDFTLTGGSDITAGDSNALLATLDESATSDVRLVVDGNTFVNASGTAGADKAAVDITVADGVTANLRVGGLFVDQERPPTVGDNNSITNSSVDGDPLRITVDGAASTLNLDLRDNTALGGNVRFVLNQTNGSTFNLVDRDDTLSGVPANANNIGPVVVGAGAINTTAPPVLAPTP